MSKLKADQIGKSTFTIKEKEWCNKYRHTLISIGLMTNYDAYNNSMNNKQEKRLNSERFSTNYKTRREFENDRTKILEYLGRMEYAPEDLVQKVSETVKELDLKIGE